MSSIIGSALGGLGGGAIGKAVVQMVLDSTKYNSDLAAAEGKTATATNTMGSGFEKFKGLAVAGAAVASAAVLKFAADSVSAAVEAEASQLKLATAVKNSGLAAEQAIPAFQAQAAALRDLTGVDDDVINAGQAVLVNMGLTQDQITELTPLVVDLSEAYGVSLNSAFKAVGKAAAGSTGGLARFIGPVEVGTTKAETYTNVLEKLGAVQGFAGEQAKAEPWRLLAAAFGEMQESVGRALLPAIQELTPAITDLVELVSPILTGVFSAAADMITPVIDALAGLTGGFDGATDSGSRFAGFMTQWAGVQQVYFDVLGAQPDLLTDLHQAWDGTTVAQEENTDATMASSDAWVDFAETQAKAARETRNATQAIQDQRLAQLQAAGGLLGLVSSLQSANDAQRELHQLQKQGKQGTAEYRQAVIDATQAQLEFRTEARQYVQDNPNRSIFKTKDALREMAAQAGISGPDFRDALGGPIGEVIGLWDTLRKKTANPIVPRFDTSGLGAAAAQASRLASQLDRLS